jgi:bifunctional DNase/RNase
MDDEEPGMEVRCDLTRIIIRDTNENQYILLKERNGDRQFHIVIGLPEAHAINRRIMGMQTARPMTHDLLASVIEHLNGKLEKIVITELREHTFYAKLVIQQDGREVEVDSRPSDAIALGVASETPIYVSEQVLGEVC